MDNHTRIQRRGQTDPPCASQPGERFIGLGEKTGNLDRRGQAYTNWNTDAFAYATDRDPIYASLPFYIGLHAGVVYGLFFDNTHKTHFNFGAANDRFSSFAAAVQALADGFRQRRIPVEAGYPPYEEGMARSSYAGGRARGRRPFILTRAAFCGIQRYGAVWTGDNVASDDHMLADVRLVNSLGLTGVPFSGYDLGGFAGEATPALFARWISIGALAPFSRGHTMINSRAAEPWAFGEEVEGIARNYLQLRYRLLPYLYSLFYDSSQTGLPVARSLAIDHPHDARVYDPAYQNQCLLGDALLVAPVASDRDVARVYLPAGAWYDLYDDAHFDGGQVITVDAPPERLPVFVRAGSVIPMQSPVQHTDQAADGVLRLHVYIPGGAGPGGQGPFVHYEDDGVSYAYEDGDFLRREIVLGPRSLQLSRCAGRYRSAFGRLRVLLHGRRRRVGGSARVNGRRRRLGETVVRFCQPLASFDPLEPGERDPYGEIRVTTLDLSPTRSAIDIRW